MSPSGSKLFQDMTGKHARRVDGVRKAKGDHNSLVVMGVYRRTFSCVFASECCSHKTVALLLASIGMSVRDGAGRVS